jgi:DNA-binding MarR family transcriptional regulator
MKPDPTMTAPAELARWTGFLLARAHGRAQALFQAALAPLELTPKSFAALSVIKEHGPLSQTTLGETLHVDRTTIVAIVDDLERAGHVTRGRSATDRRYYSLTLTPPGIAASRVADRVARRTHDELLADLTPSERDQLQTLLTRIAR